MKPESSHVRVSLRSPDAGNPQAGISEGAPGNGRSYLNLLRRTYISNCLENCELLIMISRIGEILEEYEEH